MIGAYATASYQTNGSTTDFDFTFACFAESEVVVTLRNNTTGAETVLTLTTHYTLTFTGSDPYTGGTVTTVATYDSGYTLVISRSVAQTQTTQLETSGPLPSDSLEDRLDRTTMMVQDLKEEVTRCIKLPISDKEAEDYSAGYATLDDSVSRKGLTLYFDASTGAPVVLAGTVPDEVTVSAYGETIVGAADAGACRTLLELGTVSLLAVSTDGTLAGNSDVYVPTQKAVKTYVDTATAGAFMDLTTTQEVASGVKTFIEAPIVPTPAANTEAANKLYVDTAHAVKRTGDVVKIAYYERSDFLSGTTLLLWDESIPQNTEGVEFLSTVITPAAVTNLLRIDVIAVLAHSASSQTTTMALFTSASAPNAVAAVSRQQYSSATAFTMHLTHWMQAGVVTPLTFTLRAGSATAGTLSFNGLSSASPQRKLGGVSASSITITEYQV